MSGSKRAWAAAVTACLAVCLTIAGCGSGGGSRSPAIGPLEKTTLNVGAVPAMDSAGFFVALREGLFARLGLEINYFPETSSDTAIQSQAEGKLDVTAGNYVSYIEAQARHAYGTSLEIIAEGSVMREGSQAIYTLPGSTIKSLGDLRGQSLGVNAPGNIDYLLDASVLTENGIDAGDVRMPRQAVAFPELIQDLAEHKYAAVTLPDPFASIAQQTLGAVALTDLDQGATQDFPIEGYVVTRKWAQQNPNTLRAFLTALEQGQQIADTSRQAVEQAFESLKGSQNGQVTSMVAAIMSLDTYPLGLDPARLQRVANVMYQFGVIKRPFSIKTMLP